MAVGFSAADFDIVPNGDLLPMPVKDDAGFQRYRATVMLPSRLQLNTLASYQSQIEVQPALGAGGTIVVTAGTGKRTLIYPAESGDEESVPAILVSLTTQVRMIADGYILADAEWILVV